MPIDAFIFDIGNVILRFDFNAAMQNLQRHCDPAAESILEQIEPVKVAYEGGRIGRSEFQAKMREILRYTGTDADFISAWEDIFTENEPMIRLIEQLETRYPLYLLSNTSDIHVDFIFARYPVFQRFTDAVYSYKVRASKPEPEIYRIALAQFGVDPSRTLFIDDLEANIRSGAEAGLRVHHYHHDHHALLLQQLQEAGVNLPASSGERGQGL
jgi:HAD superfamily hydrolase (TIGR01509 family)